MKSKAWSLAGKLNYARSGHATYFDGQKFMVVGGRTKTKEDSVVKLKNEVCTLDKVRFLVHTENVFIMKKCRIKTKRKTLTCEEIDASFTLWKTFPEYFLVDDDYGENCQN